MTRVGTRILPWSSDSRSLRPAGLLIQVLRADKDALAKQGWRRDWEPFTQQPEASPAVCIEGVQLACADAAAASRLFVALLGAESDGDTLGWPDSSMRVHLADETQPGFVRLRPGGGGGPDVARSG